MSDDKNENGQTWSGFFTAFRDEGGPTLYGHNRTPVTVDVLEIGFIFAAAILTLSFLLILPAYRGCGGKSVTLLKIVIGVFVTLVIFLCNFGQEWEVAHIHTKTIYRAGSKHEIDADIGVKIGLRSVNITLKGKPEYQKLSEHETEQINYNERFDWSVNMWEQGRGGFGPFASAVNQEFREAQFRGAPYPILWIAEYFTIDGEGIRWGRFYRQAGFYAHIMMWLAFPCWVLALILFQSVLFYGVMFSWLTAACHFVACLIFVCVRNPLKLKIPFEDDTLEFSWGWTFYLSIINGLICFILGLVVLVMDLKCPDDINTFFGNDTLNDLEEFYVSADELKELGIEIDTGSPSGGSVSTTVESLNGSVRSLKSLKSSKASSTVSPAFKGPVKRISNITIPDIDEEDGEVYEGKEVIQMFRRKTKSIHNLAHRLKNLQIKSKSDGPHLQTPVPAPESPVMPNSPVYKNVDPITEEEPQGEAYENIDVTKGAQNSNNNNQRPPFKLLPEGQTIRAKTKGPVERRKNKKH